MLQPALYRISEFYSVSSLLSDDWFSLLLPVLFAVILFFCWDVGFVYQRHKSWLKQHKDLIVQYQILQEHLNDFGQQVSCCKNCNQNDMQLWNFQKQLLVVRCSSCKMNYTFVKGKNELLFKVLNEIELVMILFNMIIAYRYHPVGRLLARTLKVDIGLLLAANVPLEIIHFTAQRKALTLKYIDITEWEAILSEDAECLAN
ncbi:hypothetical protein OAE12_01040 [bacterium]|nr:hypothetical protein [bacterium]